MGAFLLLVPFSLLSAKFGWVSWLQFFASVGAIIPLAAYIGSATEGLADRLGGKIGGLLNATFGNSPDLLVGVFGVQKGLIPLVKATLIGALISNSALIMGLCYIVAGLIYRAPRFKRAEAGHHSILMMLTVAAVLFPSVASQVMCGGSSCANASSSKTILSLSVGISIVLLLAYGAYVVYGILGFESLQRSETEGRELRFLKERQLEDHLDSWPVWFSVAVLAAATLALVPVTDILTGSVEPVTRVLGWTQVFVGIIIVANAGNVAEGYAALKFAVRRGGTPETAKGGDSGLDLSIGIASASSIQIATFVAPIVVLYSLTTHNLTLAFSPIEVAILTLLVVIFTHTSQDGESNWLEGVQLLALYAMAAVVFFVVPASVFGK
jgi:Ca2+:H+ antiporter